MPVPDGGIAVDVKLRSAQPPLPAMLFKDKVILKQPAFGISAGQACVCYIGNRIIGGGWITATDCTQMAVAA